jgi:hypothetical protein
MLSNRSRLSDLDLVGAHCCGTGGEARWQATARGGKLAGARPNQAGVLNLERGLHQNKVHDERNLTGERGNLKVDDGSERLDEADGGSGETPARPYGRQKARRCEQVAPVTSCHPCGSPELLLGGKKAATTRIESGGAAKIRRRCVELEGTRV